jgi:hypothetical protein
MARKRRQYGSLFKAKEALAALRGDKTLTEIESQFGIPMPPKCFARGHSQRMSKTGKALGYPHDDEIHAPGP